MNVLTVNGERNTTENCEIFTEMHRVSLKLSLLEQ